MYIHHVCVQEPEDVRRKCQIRGAGVTSGCEPSYMGAGNLTWVFCRGGRQDYIERPCLRKTQKTCWVWWHFTYSTWQAKISTKVHRARKQEPRILKKSGRFMSTGLLPSNSPTTAAGQSRRREPTVISRCSIWPTTLRCRGRESFSPSCLWDLTWSFSLKHREISQPPWQRLLIHNRGSLWTSWASQLVLASALLPKHAREIQKKPRDLVPIFKKLTSLPAFVKRGADTFREFCLYPNLPICVRNSLISVSFTHL